MSQSFCFYAEAAPAPQGGGIEMFLPLILMAVIMYFMLIRPQRRRQLELRKQIEALRSGDKVVTAAGIHGLITNVKKSTVMLKIADNVKIEIDKAAVATILSKADEPEEEETATDVDAEVDEDLPKSGKN